MPVEDRLRYDKDATRQVLAYDQGVDKIALVVSPLTKVPKSFDYPTFGKGAFLYQEDCKRAIGADVKKYNLPDLTWTPTELEEYALKDCTDRQTAGRSGVVKGLPHTDIGMLNKVLKKALDQRLSYLVATTALTCSNSTAASTAWDQASPTTVADIRGAYLALKDQCGMAPNGMIVPDRVLTWMGTNVRTAFGITTNDSNIAVIKQVLLPEIGIPAQNFLITTTDAYGGTTFDQLWGDNVLLYYSSPGLWEPSFMKTFIPDDKPYVVALPPWDKDDKSGQWTEVYMEMLVKMTGEEACHIITGCLT